MPAEELEQRLARLEKALTEIDTARARLVEEIQTLRLGAVTTAHTLQAPAVTMNSRTADKLALFRSLFGGRTDVYAQRWDNPKTGKSGYSPACQNEWAKGICDKPRIKCGDCPNQAFKAFDDAAALRHLTGKPAGKASKRFCAKPRPDTSLGYPRPSLERMATIPSFSCSAAPSVTE